MEKKKKEAMTSTAAASKAFLASIKEDDSDALPLRGVFDGVKEYAVEAAKTQISDAAVAMQTILGKHRVPVQVDLDPRYVCGTKPKPAPS